MVSTVAGLNRCLRYIDRYWDRITFSFPRDKKIHIGLPHRYVAPNSVLFKNDQFYWDSYFIVIGLLEAGKTQLAKGMVDNFIHLYERFGIIPSRNRFHNVASRHPLAKASGFLGEATAVEPKLCIHLLF